MNGDGDVGDTVGCPDEDLVFAPKHAGNAPKLAKVVHDGGNGQGGGDAGESDGGDGVAWRPTVDKGAAAEVPRDAIGEGSRYFLYRSAVKNASLSS